MINKYSIHSKKESKKEKANSEKEALSIQDLNSIHEKNLGTFCQNLLFNEKLKQTSPNFNFCNSNFLLKDRLNMLNNPATTFKNDFSPSKGLTFEPFYSPIFDNNDSGKNSKSISTPDSPNMEISDRVCNFRTYEIFDTDIENKILEQKLPNSNSKSSDKIYKWKGDLTFSSKKMNKTKNESQVKKIKKEIFNYIYNFNSPSKKDFFPEITKEKKISEENLYFDINISPLSNISNQQVSKSTLPQTEIKIHKCACEKSQCKKKYCECFLNGKKCNKDICNCVNCENSENLENGNINLLRNSTHFEENEANKENINILNLNQNSSKKYKHKIELLNKKPSPNRNFCNCTHSKCNSRYCECFKNNRTCNRLCRCLKCINKDKLKNIYGNNKALQSFDHISVSIVNNELSVCYYTEKIEILGQKKKRKNEKNNINIFKSPHINECKTPLFTTTCETTASRKISNMDHIVEKINKDGKFVRRKIEMKKFNNRGMFDLNENKDESNGKNINHDK